MTDTIPPRPFDLLPSEPDWMLLGRFFRGECSADEVEAIARWKAAGAANADLVAFMRQVWDAAAVGAPDIDEDQGWRAMQARIAAARPRLADVAVLPFRAVPRADAPYRRVWLGRVTAAAALIAVALGGVLVWRTRDLGARATRAVAREYVTAPGQRAEVMLDDGTRVWLNVASRLRVFGGYGGVAREVEVDGEAYFAVEHDPARPFRVRSRGAISEDLGTEFDMRAYAGDPAVAVTVVAGRVAVRADTAPTRTGLVLVHGQMARIDSAGRIVVTDVDLARALGWRDGRLTFQELPLAEVLRELARWYDLEIVVDDSSLTRVPLTASLSQQTGDQALAIIAGVLDAQYARHGRQVHFKAKPTRP